MRSLFQIEYNGIPDLLFRGSVLLACCAILWYVTFFILARLLYRKAGHHKDHALPLCALWSLALVMFYFSIYFFVLIKRTGAAVLTEIKWETLAALSPLLVAYLLLITGFVLVYYHRRKKVKSTKII